MVYWRNLGPDEHSDLLEGYGVDVNNDTFPQRLVQRRGPLETRFFESRLIRLGLWVSSVEGDTRNLDDLVDSASEVDVDDLLQPPAFSRPVFPRKDAIVGHPVWDEKDSSEETVEDIDGLQRLFCERKMLEVCVRMGCFVIDHGLLQGPDLTTLCA